MTFKNVLIAAAVPLFLAGCGGAAAGGNEELSWRWMLEGEPGSGGDSVWVGKHVLYPSDGNGGIAYVSGTGEDACKEFRYSFDGRRPAADERGVECMATVMDVYRFLAENTQRIAQLKRAPVYSDDDCTSWWITDGLRIWDATPREKEKIPAVVLTASLIRNPDERLQALADELNERCGGSWLIPVFMKAILTQPKEQVYETYSPLLGTPKASYLLNALGLLDYRSYPEDWAFERSGPDGLRALIFWGDYSYGTYDTRFTIERYVELDERWLFALAKDPEGKKPAVTWQTYNRGGVLYGSYDEMLISLLPRKVENPELRRALRDYFRIRSEKVSVEESITVYKDAAERFGGE